MNDVVSTKCQYNMKRTPENFLSPLPSPPSILKPSGFTCITKKFVSEDPQSPEHRRRACSDASSQLIQRHDDRRRGTFYADLEVKVVEPVPRKNPPNHPRFGDVTEIDAIDANSFNRLRSSVDVSSPQKEEVKEKTKEVDLTFVQSLKQTNKVIWRNRTEYCLNLSLALLVLLMLVPSILFAIFEEPDDPYQYQMTPNSILWPLKRQFVMYHEDYNKGSSLKVSWGNNQPSLYSIPNLCKDKRPWCYSWPQNSFLLLTPVSLKYGIDCMKFEWQNLTTNFIQFSDCFDINNASAYWFGGPLGLNTAWPINNRASLGDVALLTGDVQTSLNNLYGVQEPFWISNTGFAVMAGSNFVVGVNQTDKMVCLRSSPFFGQLKYAVCRGPDTKTLVMRRNDIKNILEPKYRTTEEDTDANISAANSSSRLNDISYSSSTTNISNPKLTYNGGTDTRITNGQFDFIVSLDATSLHRQDVYDLIWMLQPYNRSAIVVVLENFNIFDTKLSSVITSILNETSLTSHYAVAIEVNNFVKVNHVNLNISFWETLCVVQMPIGLRNTGAPKALGSVVWRDLLYFVIDFTLPEVQKIFAETLMKNQVMEITDYISFTGGTASELPVQAVMNVSERNLNSYTQTYTEFANTFNNTISVASAFNNQESTLTNIDIPITHDNISSIVPVFLTLNVLGYSNLILDIFVPESTTSNIGNSTDQLTILFSLAMFLPMFRMSYKVLQYPLFQTVYNKFITVRENVIMPHFVNASLDYLATGNPIIRPVWWADSNVDIVWTTDNEFMVGDNLLVIAFLMPGANSYSIYLPSGLWRNSLDANICRSGPHTMSLISSPMIICYEKILDPNECVSHDLSVAGQIIDKANIAP